MTDMHVDFSQAADRIEQEWATDTTVTSSCGDNDAPFYHRAQAIVKPADEAEEEWVTDSSDRGKADTVRGIDSHRATVTIRNETDFITGNEPYNPKDSDPARCPLIFRYRVCLVSGAWVMSITLSAVIVWNFI